MTTKQEAIQLLDKLYTGKEVTLTADYALRSAISQLEETKVEWREFK